MMYDDVGDGGGGDEADADAKSHQTRR